jgi:hypothetical protein
VTTESITHIVTNFADNGTRHRDRITNRTANTVLCGDSLEPIRFADILRLRRIEVSTAMF